MLLSRRQFVSAGVGGALAFGVDGLMPAWARTHSHRQALNPARSASGAFELNIGAQTVMVDGRSSHATTINGTLPGPLLRFREGEQVTLNVTNNLEEDTSIHWHGLILPPGMDGVPKVSFPGIHPGETFTYQYRVEQSGTYWYHSHSGFQEQTGVFGPIIIDPARYEPIRYDREYVVVLSDWLFEDPHRVYAKLKSRSSYFNFQKRTVGDFFNDVSRNGLQATVNDRLMWGRMRMDPTDIADITGAAYTYLMNGVSSASNWTGLFRPGERVRLRFINAAAATYFDVRIPGLKMTVVQADGQNVQPVSVDEFRIAVAETYDVIVEPDSGAYTIFAETADRSGYASGTLAARPGMTAPVPERRKRPLRTMADMGMMPMGMNMAGGEMPGMTMNKGMQGGMPGISEMPMAGGMRGKKKTYKHGPDKHGPLGSAMIVQNAKSKTDQPGAGLENAQHRVLVYDDLRSTKPGYDKRKPSREIELHLTGIMDRYIWSFDGKKFSDADGPIEFVYGERLRLVLWNDTMMSHPIHLHGMWMELDNGASAYKPRKHTVNVKPGERLAVEITADAPGNWAFHCHILYHMEAGMFRVVSVSSPVPGSEAYK
jgi:CopA family copper-resistance protein